MNPLQVDAARCGIGEDIPMKGLGPFMGIFVDMD